MSAYYAKGTKARRAIRGALTIIIGAVAVSVMVVSGFIAGSPTQAAHADTFTWSTVTSGIKIVNNAAETFSDSFSFFERSDEKSIRITDGSNCLTNFSWNRIIHNGDGPVVPAPCGGDGPQKFTFVPDVNFSHATTSDYQRFYLVSIEDDGTERCLSTGQATFLSNLPSLAKVAICEAHNPNQEWSIMNDKPDPAGFNPAWEAILQQATDFATQNCSSTRCQIVPSTGPDAGQAFAYGDPHIIGEGNFVQTNAGCGSTSSTGGVPQVQNNTNDTVDETVSSTLQTDNSSQVTDSTSSSLELSATLGIGSSSVSATGTITVGHTVMQTAGTSASISSSVTAHVQPGMWLTGLWSQSTYVVAGTWRMGVNVELPWSLSTQSNFPITSGSNSVTTYSPTVSHSQKNCNVGPASVNSAPPRLTSDPNSCLNSTPTPATGLVGATVYACAGTWQDTIGVLDANGVKDHRNPANFSYRWYLTAGGQDVAHPIAGATGSSYVINSATLGDGSMTQYLGVIVTEEGPASRLESAGAIAPQAVQLHQVFAPVFTADSPPTSVVGGSLFSYQFAANGYPAPSFSAQNGLIPPGWNLSPSGLLTGTEPAGSSDTIVVIADNGVDHVLGAAHTIIGAETPTFSSDAAPAATAGTAYHYRFAADGFPTPTFTVSRGSLPSGWMLNSDGVLSGTTVSAGIYTFTVTATSGASSLVGDSQIIKVNPGVQTALSVIPQTAGSAAYSAVDGTPMTLMATGVDAYGNIIKDITPTLSTVNVKNAKPDQIIGNTVTFHTAGLRTVNVTSGDITTVVPVTVTAGMPTKIILSASRFIIDRGDSVTLSVSGTDADGDDVANLTSQSAFVSNWAVDVISGATVTFPHASTHVITATMNGITSTVTITVNEPAAAILAPPTVVEPPIATSTVTNLIRGSELTSGIAAGAGTGITIGSPANLGSPVGMLPVYGVGLSATTSNSKAATASPPQSDNKAPRTAAVSGLSDINFWGYALVLILAFAFALFFALRRRRRRISSI